MGWISDRAMRRGTSLYDGGPKRKGPLRKIVGLTTVGYADFFGSSSGWLECGHFSERIFGREKAICTKCRVGLPKDVCGDDGWPIVSLDQPPRRKRK